MFSGEDLGAILRRFKIVTSAELGPAPPRQEGEEGCNLPQQVQKLFIYLLCSWSKLNLDKENIVFFFNYFIKGMAEQEEAQQGVGGGQLGDDLQVGDICKSES